MNRKARKRISEAMKERWAKYKIEKKEEVNSGINSRTISVTEIKEILEELNHFIENDYYTRSESKCIELLQKINAYNEMY